jgi:ribonuclease VapC
VIVLDGSALLAILLHEAERDRCAAIPEREQAILLSAASLSEILIVAMSKNVLTPAQDMLTGLDPEVIPVTEQRDHAVSDAYRLWGKGFHAARLTINGCFAYALAKEHRCPLLFVGNGFALTDVVPASM